MGHAITVRREETPNPNACTFTCSVPVVESGRRSFMSASASQGDRLGEALFALEGVATVFATSNYVTITKEASQSWGVLGPEVKSALVSVLDSKAAL